MRLAGLLLSVLALIIRCVVGVILRLLVAICGITCPLSACCSVSCGRSISCSVSSLRGAETLLLIIVGRLDPRFWSTPWGNIRPTSGDIVPTHVGGIPRRLSGITGTGVFSKFSHQACVLRIESCPVKRRWGTIDRNCLSVRIFIDGTIPGHVTRAATNATNDVSSEVALFWAIIFSVTNTTTVLTNLVFIITKGSIQCC